MSRNYTESTINLLASLLVSIVTTVVAAIEHEETEGNGGHFLELNDTTSLPTEKEKHIKKPWSWTIPIFVSLFMLTIIIKTMPTVILHMIYGGPPPKWHQSDEPQIAMTHRASKKMKKKEAAIHQQQMLLANLASNNNPAVVVVDAKNSYNQQLTFDPNKKECQPNANGRMCTISELILNTNGEEMKKKDGPKPNDDSLWTRL